MKTNIVLTEYSEALLQISLTDDDRRYLQEASTINPKTPWERRFYLDELKYGVRIKTVSFVGTIELSSCRIIIQPKFNNGFYDVMKMIAFTEQIPFTTNRHTKATHDKSDLFILFAEQFLTLAERLTLQFKKDYVVYQEDLKSVRGRIQMLETATSHFLIPKGVVCEFDELTTDILENQIILTVLQLIQKHPLFRGNRQLKKLLSQYESICRPYDGKHYPTFHYNRLNHQYEAIHKIGKMLFEGLFIDNYQGKGMAYMTILVDMNDLFERFVMQLLKKYLPKNYSLQHGKSVTDAITRDNKSYRYIIPDIVVINKETKAAHVVDTKYKFYDQKRIETSDIFQLTFYAQYFKKEAPYHSMIIHPVFDGYQERSFTIDTNKHNLPGRITVQSIQIEKVLDWISKRQQQELKNMALNILK